MSERDCSFAACATRTPREAGPTTLSSTSSSPHESRSASPGGNESRQLYVWVPANENRPTLPLNPAIPFSGFGLRPEPLQDPTLCASLNLSHMELFAHLVTDKSMFNLTDRPDNREAPIPLAFALSCALEFPYLLHQALAFSARHLAHQNPKRADFYLQQAVGLQTRAVSLFNEAWTANSGLVDQSNCVAVLLFSTFLGHDVLAETLAKRDGGALHSFLHDFVRCVEMVRGVYTVATSTWPMLMESELHAVLAFSRDVTSREPIGDHCKALTELIEDSEQLAEGDRDACLVAIRYLQISFDVTLVEPSDSQRADSREEQPDNKYHMIFKWTMLLPPQFLTLLATQRPEALIILAYYALLLHHGREMWQIEDSGSYILSLVSDHLGPQWDPWLARPRKIMQDCGGRISKD